MAQCTVKEKQSEDPKADCNFHKTLSEMQPNVYFKLTRSLPTSSHASIPISSRPTPLVRCGITLLPTETRTRVHTRPHTARAPRSEAWPVL